MTTRVGTSKREHQVMEVVAVNADGNATYIERTISGYAWACDDCGLVWEKKWYAESCERRGHPKRFDQHYGGITENGAHKGGTSYTRFAIGRK
jgi:hypothetical protein